MNDRERLFWESHKTETGHIAISEPGGMAFIRNGFRTTYRPDFYCFECGIYFEVAGTRQAFCANIAKIRDFQAAYPNLSLKIVNPDGTEYGATHREYKPRSIARRPYKLRPALEYRAGAVKRLANIFTGPSFDLRAMAKDTGLTLDTIRYLANGNHLPQPETAKLIHAYIDKINHRNVAA